MREAYLPESILAYVSTLQHAGELLTRDFCMEGMDLAAIIADDDSDLLAIFRESGRLEELVELFAQVGKQLLILTSQQRKGNQAKSKKLRMKGWTPELWSVKS